MDDMKRVLNKTLNQQPNQEKQYVVPSIPKVEPRAPAGKAIQQTVVERPPPPQPQQPPVAPIAPPSQQKAVAIPIERQLQPAPIFQKPVDPKHPYDAYISNGLHFFNNQSFTSSNAATAFYMSNIVNTSNIAAQQPKPSIPTEQIITNVGAPGWVESSSSATIMQQLVPAAQPSLMAYGLKIAQPNTL